MSRLEDLNIPALTKVAESGDGCALRETVDKLFYEERLAVLKRIEEQNKLNRSADPSLPDLKSFTTAPENFYLGGINLRVRGDNKYNVPVIYKDRFVVTTGGHIS